MSDSIEIKLSKLVDLNKAKKEQIHSLPPPEKCDLCAKKLSEEKYFIDGALKSSGSWANMCPKCFSDKGQNIGWGEGQLYMQETKGSWLLVAGFRSAADSTGDTECSNCGEEFDRKDMVEVRDGEWACKNCIEIAESFIDHLGD